MDGRCPWWRWALRLAATTLACLLALSAPAGRAAAHATLVGTDPAAGSVLPTAPERASLRFDEPVSLPANGVQFFDAAGTRLPVTASTLDAVVTVELPTGLDGTYILAWRVVSDDGHPVAGSLTFSVGRASPQVNPPPTTGTAERPVVLPLGIAQALLYAGLLLTLGLTVFAAFVLPAPPVARRLRDRIGALLPWTAAAASAGALAGLPLTVADQQGLTIAAVTSPATWAAVPTSALVASGVVLAGLALCVAASGRGRTPPVARSLAGAGALVAAAGPSLSGHTRAVEPQLLLIAVDVLHVLTGGVWLGGLVGLAVALGSARVRHAQAVGVLTRFSALAAGLLGLLVISGTILAWRIVGTWEALFGTGYGRLLLAKIALGVVAVALAGWNRFVLLPSARSERSRDGTVAPGRRRIGRVVAAEAAVLALVVGVTGFLVDQSPRTEPASAAPRPTGVGRAQLGDLVVLAELVPARVGRSRLHVQLQDAAGEPVEPAHPPEVRLRSDLVDLGEVELAGEAAGTWAAPVVLPAPGAWRVQVGLQLGEFENPVTTIPLTVG